MRPFRLPSWRLSQDQFEFLRPDWSALSPWNGLIGAIGVGALLLTGVLTGQLAASAIAASGAIAVAFGAVMAFSSWRGAPLVLAGIGMAICAVIGSLAGQELLALCIVSAACAALTALATTLGVGAWWIALQWSVALLIAGSFPADWTGALERGGLVLLGAAIQGGVTLLSWRWRGPGVPLEESRPVRESFGLLKAKFAERRHRGLFTLRAAVAVVAATLIAHRVGLANGYWAPLTTLVVLKPQWRDTWRRGVLRVLGTFVGAAVAGGLALLLKDQGVLIALAAFLAAFVAISLQRVNYALFTLFLTAYVVFALSLLRTPAPVIAAHRLAATLIGGAVALGLEGMFAPFNPWRELEQPRANDRPRDPGSS